MTKGPAALTPALLDGTAQGVTLSITLAGPLCLWSGFSSLLSASPAAEKLTAAISPLFSKLFPQAWQNREIKIPLSGNFTANLLGLGNAATPLGVEAARRMSVGGGHASDELCRLVVLNTASVQLLPTTVAALRSSLGCRTPFDLLPAVWITSLASVTVGLLAAFLFSRWVS